MYFREIFDRLDSALSKGKNDVIGESENKFWISIWLYS
jgi:hypothetical protein